MSGDQVQGCLPYIGAPAHINLAHQSVSKQCLHICDIFSAELLPNHPHPTKAPTPLNGPNHDFSPTTQQIERIKSIIVIRNFTIVEVFRIFWALWKNLKLLVFRQGYKWALVGWILLVSTGVLANHQPLCFSQSCCNSPSQYQVQKPNHVMLNHRKHCLFTCELISN